MKIFLTGSPGAGKSTVMLKVIERLRAEGLKIGGITTPEVRGAHGDRTAFKVVDLASGEEGTLASVDQPSGPRVGKYRVNIQDFERVALLALNYALEECDVVCVDELGTMEFFLAKFKQKVKEVLESGKPVVAVVHRNYARFYEKTGTIFRVTLENREKITRLVVTEILGKLKKNHFQD
jgi:nucleoside-triphosphatase